MQGLSKIFDPLGFVAPMILRAKLLMQKLWQLKVTWDELLNKDIEVKWIEIATNLKKATQFSVSQYYINACMTHLVTAKTRVALLKTLTIPWLELMAAMVGTRLTNFVITAISVHNPTVFMWLDSQIVLHLIKSKKSLPTFVHHHITEMYSLLPNATWNYYPTAENPADLLSRGTTTAALMSSSLWKQRPKWLTTPHQWPSPQLPHLRPLVLAAAVATEFVPIEQAPPDCIISISRYATLNKLLLVTVYILHFVDNLRVPPQQRQCGPINAEIFHRANLHWIKDTQQAVY